MKPFRYERAATVASACASATGPTAKFIAGGTNLLDLMKLQIETPTHLVDIGPLPLAEIEETAEGGLRIGARVTNSALAADMQVRRRYPVLSQAIPSLSRRARAALGCDKLWVGRRWRCGAEDYADFYRRLQIGAIADQSQQHEHSGRAAAIHIQ
jgi:CO/xanthine dehydrogenase FAD-binding subunit